MDSSFFAVGGFLVTFAVHSTVLLLLALGLRPWLAKSAHLEETIWRFAMFGGLFTSLVQRWLGFPAFRELEFVAVESPFGLTGEAALEIASPVVSEFEAGTGIAAMPESLEPAPYAQAWSIFADWASWLPFVLAAYALVVGCLAVVRVRAFRRFLRHVSDRVEVRDPSVLLSLVTLQRSAGLYRPVRLTSSARLRSPVAFGVFQREICVPEAVLRSMEPQQRDCVLAHEMAHLRAGDAAWLILYEIWTCFFAFQPLLSVARRRLDALAEFRCDAWVVAQTGDRVGMANTLVEVAEWMSGRPDPIVAPAMAHGPSSLTSRVERILESASIGGPRFARRTQLLAGVVLAAVGIGVPGVRLSPSTASLSTRAPSAIQQQLIELEGEIADLHTSLAQTWRLLGGRDLPEVTETLQAMQRRLHRMTDERAGLWREATARASDSK